MRNKDGKLIEAKGNYILVLLSTLKLLAYKQMQESYNDGVFQE